MKDNKIEEVKNKQLIRTMIVMLLTTFIFYLGIIILTSYTLEEGFLYGLIVCISTIIFVSVAFYSLKIEVEAGYYECKKCHNKFKPKYFEAVIAPHFNFTRYLKCPKCNEISWTNKVMTK